MVRAIDDSTLSDDEVEVLLDLTVWVPTLGDDDPGQAVVIVFSGEPHLAAFSSFELGLAADLGQTNLVPSTVWDCLRGLPEGTGLVLDPGQDAQLLVAAAEVDELLRGPRADVPSLSPPALAALAHRWVVIAAHDGRWAMCDDGSGPPAVAAWIEPEHARRKAPDHVVRQAVLSDVLGAMPDDVDLVLDPGGPEQRRLDATLRTAILDAAQIFPQGHRFGLRPATTEGLALLDAIDQDGLPAMRAYGYRTSGAPDLVLVDVDSDDDSPAYAAALDAIAEACRLVRPDRPVRVVPRAAIPAAAPAQ